MKRVFCLLLCLAVCAAAVSGFCGAAASAETGPVLRPLAVAVIPSQYAAPRITKNPTDEWVNEYGRCQFVSRYENAILAEWHFVSPDGWRDITYLQAQQEFPPLRVIMGNTKDMTLDNIPYSLNGWRVYCRFSNSYGFTDTAMARITVAPGQGGSYPRPTGNAMIVYYANGVTERLSAYSDGSWRTSAGILYTMGTDGVLRAAGYPDLYPYSPSYSPSYTPSAPQQDYSGEWRWAYTAGGARVTLNNRGDGTWRSETGILYYEGNDGVLRARGAEDLYFR